MPLESTMICVDNSEYMRNGDYIPTRLQAQQDAVNTICRYKLMANPENNVGLLTLANTEVLATLTTDAGKILTTLHRVQPTGFINLLTGIRIAHLALKHRQSKNHKMRIVVFVGSPIKVEDKEVTKLAKRLKKENVNIDVINFGETEDNQTMLEALINTINGREGSGSHLVTVPPSPHLADALMSSPIIQGEDGTGPTNFGSGGGFEFGVDPNEDPELVLALRVSMEEQRQRQQEEERKSAQDRTGEDATTTTSATTATTVTSAATTNTATKVTDAPAASNKGANKPTESVTMPAGGQSEDEMLQQALAMSLESGMAGGATDEAEMDSPVVPPASASKGGTAFPDFSSMTEEEQIAYAMQISLQGCHDTKSESEPMDVDKEPQQTKGDDASPSEGKEVEFSEVISDPALLENILQSLPGTDDKDKKDKKKDKEEK